MLAITTMVYSQQEIAIENPNYKNFKELNVNNIPTGILLDYGYAKTDVKQFNGILKDSTYTSRESLNAVYQTLLTAVVQKKNNLNYLDLFQKWQNHRKENTITLAGVLYAYNAINPTAIQNGKMQLLNTSSNTIIPASLAIAEDSGLSSDTILFRENPNPSNLIVKNTPLYTHHYAFAMSPSINEFNNSRFSVVLPKDIMANNIDIANIHVNFNDGKGYQKLNYGIPITVNYNRINTYTWTYKVQLTNGTVLYSHSKFKVNRITKIIAQRNATSGVILDNTRVTAIKNGKAYHGFLEVVDRGLQGIQNPVIVAEGFDTGIVTSPEKPEGENTGEMFRISTANMNDDEDEFNPLLRNELYFRNRDIIYVNWHNGMDYIQNNAEVLKEVIRMVNAAKKENKNKGHVTSPNIVIGQSMGGLVARYALKDMEDNNEDHDTRLYVSHDTPHQGANAPLSVQYLLRHMRKLVIRNPLVYTASESIVPLFNDGIGGSDYYNLFNNPAVRQMVLNWVDKDFNINNSVHNAWQQELKAKGYPRKTRNVAIANGDACGNFNPVGKNILEIRNTRKVKKEFEVLLSAILGLQSLRLDLTVLSLIPGSAKYEFNVSCKPVLRNGTGKYIYDGSIAYEKKILWFIPAKIILTERSIKQPANLLPYGELPGGFFNLAEEALPEDIRDVVTVTSASFIPTISALDYGRGNISHTQSAYQQVIYRDNTNIPFDAYVLERGGNRGHISFSNLNSRWLVDELRENIPHQALDEAIFCSEDKNILVEEGFECSGGATKFAADFNAPRFQWKIAEGNHLIYNLSDVDQREIRFQVRSNIRGRLRVELKFGDANFNRSTTIFKEYWIGKPYAVGELVSICTNVFVQPSSSPVVRLPESGGADTYFIKSDQRELELLDGGNFRPNQVLRFGAARAGRYTATLTTRNKCGTSTGKIYVSAKDCNSGGFGFSVFPNPSENGILTIRSVAEENNTVLSNFQKSISARYITKSSLNLKEDKEEVVYKLYDFNNVLFKEGVLNDVSNELNLSSLKKGIYILKIYKGKEDETHQIIIK